MIRSGIGREASTGQGGNLSYEGILVKNAALAYGAGMKTRFFPAYPPSPGTVIEPEMVDFAPLAGRTVAIIGYGTMGRAQALNLRRSGLDVVVGARQGSLRGALAVQEGFTVLDPAPAAAAGDPVMLMLPDEAVAGVFDAVIAPYLRPGATVGFAHGFGLAFAGITATRDHPCFLAAPKGQGDMLLSAHAAGGGVPGLLAAVPEESAATWDLAASYAKAVGCLAGGGFVTTFRDECVSDQFGEQAVLCGGVIELLKAAFDIMVEAGYGRENAYFECVHELKLITDLIHGHGIDGMRRRISGTAAYGGLTRGPEIIDQGVRERMRDVLARIENGEFAREFLARHDDPVRGTDALAEAEAAGPLAAAGRELQRRLNRFHPRQDPASRKKDPERKDES